LSGSAPERSESLRISFQLDTLKKYSSPLAIHLIGDEEMVAHTFIFRACEIYHPLLTTVSIHISLEESTCRYA
jgi:hypothetical protein